MLGHGKSYRYAYRTKRAIGFLFAGLLILTQVDTSRAQASLSGDFIDPPQVADDSDHNLDLSVDNQRAPTSKFARHEAAKPLHDKCFTATQGFDLGHSTASETLQYFYCSSKFATFDIKLRKSRDPPNLAV